MSDLISRADAIEAVRSFFKDLLGKSKCDYDDELQVYVISKEEKTLLIYNKRINDKLRSLPSAEAVSREPLDIFAQMYRAERESLPSADAVQGEWIIHGEPPWLVRECSECGTKWHQWSGDKTPNYCGNCGARMKGGAE